MLVRKVGRYLSRWDYTIKGIWLGWAKSSVNDSGTARTKAGPKGYCGSDDRPARDTLVADHFALTKRVSIAVSVNSSCPPVVSMTSAVLLGVTQRR